MVRYVTTFAGYGAVTGFGGEGGPATLTPLDAPQGVTTDATGNVFIADTGHDRVILVDTAGNIHPVAGTGMPGDSGDGASMPQLQARTGRQFDGVGNVTLPIRRTIACGR